MVLPVCWYIALFFWCDMYHNIKYSVKPNCATDMAESKEGYGLNVFSYFTTRANSL